MPPVSSACSACATRAGDAHLRELRAGHAERLANRAQPALRRNFDAGSAGSNTVNDASVLLPDDCFDAHSSTRMFTLLDISYIYLYTNFWSLSIYILTYQVKCSPHEQGDTRVPPTRISRSLSSGARSRDPLAHAGYARCAISGTGSQLNCNNARLIEPDAVRALSQNENGSSRHPPAWRSLSPTSLRIC